MKGTFFAKPLEFNLQVDGESWTQGVPISGKLVIRNHGNDPVQLNDVSVSLARGTLRLVRQKSEKAFDIIDQTPLPPRAPLSKGDTAEFQWKFETNVNCPVTDNTSSLFLLYGQGKSSPALGQLQLTVLPHPVIMEFVDTLKVQFRFVAKTIKAGKHGVEIKIDPPDGQSYAAVEQLVLSCRFEGEALQLRYVFDVKKVENTGSAFDVKKQKKEITQTLESSVWRTSTGRIDHTKFEGAIAAALSQVESKVFAK